MELELILAGLQQVPKLIAAAQTIRASLGETDQAKLDALLTQARDAANRDVDQAEADLRAAGGS